MEIANTTPLAAHCGQCPLKSRCLPGPLDQEQSALFNQIVNHNRVLRQGAHAFTAGEQFQAIYMVRAGAVKTYCLTEEGEEQVTGFYSVGDCFGFDGIHTQRHSNAAKALVRSQLCEIPFDSLEKLCTRIPHLQHHTFQLISQQILEEQKRMYLMGKCSAEARVAFLLQQFVRRDHGKGRIGETSLPMTRYDIANFLGLSVETVSRILSRLHQQGIIRLQGRLVRVLAPDALQARAQDEVQRLPVHS